MLHFISWGFSYFHFIKFDVICLSRTKFYRKLNSMESIHKTQKHNGRSAKI